MRSEPVASRGVVATMAVTTGVVVANIYYAQPLEAELTRALHTTTAGLGVVLTLIQVGYAVGLATLVPLGDRFERRRLLATLLATAALGLVAMALAGSVAVLAVAGVVVGLASVAVQVVVPFAAHLAAPHEQGRVVSMVMSGLLVGILLSRTASGLAASVAGWRTVFLCAAVLTVLMGLLLWRALPELEPLARLPYHRLLASVLTLLREEPVLRRRIGYGAVTFASFSAFWATVGFLLARPPYAWGNAAIGAFALVGAAGAVAATLAGRLADRGRAGTVTGAALATMALSYLLLALGGRSIWALGAGALLMDAASQAVQISNQSLIYRLRPDARSRLTTAYMTGYFLAGAAGSALSATVLYPRFGWSAVCLLGGALPAVGAVCWLVGRLVGRLGGWLGGWLGGRARRDPAPR